MKKITLVFALLLTFVTIQISAQTEAEANLTVKLNKIQSITVLSPNVVIELATAEDYKNGITKTVNNHLNVFSTGGYIVRVSSAQTNLTNTNGKTLAVDNISISANGSGAVANPVVLQNPATGIQAPILIESATSTSGTNYNVSYIAAGNEANYVAAFDTAGPDDLDFKVDVLYTIETN